MCANCEAYHQRLWQRVRAWEREHTNGAEVSSREPDFDRLLQILELHKSDPAAAVEAWHALAEEGSIWSMFYIGWAYEHGSGIERNLAEAEKWYDRASGYQYALLCSARLAAERGDYPACEAMLKIGVDQEWAPAEFRLAWYKLGQSGSRQTARDVQPLLERATADGHPMAPLLLGQLMAWGRLGLRQIPRGFRMIRNYSSKSQADDEAAQQSGGVDPATEQVARLDAGAKNASGLCRTASGQNAHGKIGN